MICAPERRSLPRPPLFRNRRSGRLPRAVVVCMPCSRVSSDGVVLRPVTALQRCSIVRGRLARSGGIWGHTGRPSARCLWCRSFSGGPRSEPDWHLSVHPALQRCSRAVRGWLPPAACTQDSVTVSALCRVAAARCRAAAPSEPHVHIPMHTAQASPKGAVQTCRGAGSLLAPVARRWQDACTRRVSSGDGPVPLAARFCLVIALRVALSHCSHSRGLAGSRSA